MRRATRDRYIPFFLFAPFQSTLSMRRATSADFMSALVFSIFQSTLSMRRATAPVGWALAGHVISIHALHEESDRLLKGFYGHPLISIHALHEESDTKHHSHRRNHLISIHALHEESDSPRFGGGRVRIRFQSTLSMRRATCAFASSRRPPSHFNPRSP